MRPALSQRIGSAVSELADLTRRERRRAMLPGSSRDIVLGIAKRALPVAALALLGILVLLPVLATQEFSFLLSKDSAERAEERMRVAEASYRGETARGETFAIIAGSAVQQTSAVPIVLLERLSAEINQAEGLATVTAPTGRFYLDENRLVVDGPVVARSASGYSLDGNAIEVDIEGNRVLARDRVSGTLPMGRFAADRFEADIEGRVVTMTGNVQLRITPQRRGG